MKNWFTVEKIDNNTFAISEYGHWEETHCYLICGAENAVLIDTGLGVADIGRIVKKLTVLPVMAVTTHVHWDHIGGHRYFDRIAVHETEKEWLLHFPIPLQAVRHNLTCKPCDFPEKFSIDDYRIYQGIPDVVFRDGDSFDLGNRRLTAVHTPGHSPGHCCFYEAGRGYLYTGDLVYLGCLDAFYPTTDPRQFFESVRKIRNLEVRRIMPGHHQLSVPVETIGRVEEAFRELDRQGSLEQGKGVFDFGDFQIHI